MKNKKGFLILLIIFVVMIAGASVLYNHFSDKTESVKIAETEKKQPENKPSKVIEAPDFMVADADGYARKLSDYFGKPVVLNFWASWCGPCKSEMPDFEAAYKEYKDEINFLMVNMTDGSRETVKLAADFISNSGYTFPVFYDTATEAAMTYAVTSIPQTYFIDKNGNIVARAQSAIDLETLRQGIDMILPK